MKTQNLALVAWGRNLGSTVGEGKFTKKIKDMVTLPPFYKSVVVGLLLSDGWLIFSHSISKNARLGLAQSYSKKAYVYFVFLFLSHYCNSFPAYRTNTRKNKISQSVCLTTRALPCLTELHKIFYVNKVKVIPSNIYDLLTPVALAHWIAGDGSVQAHGLILCTDSYSIQEVVLLINVLIVKYGLECTLRNHLGIYPRIYIRQRSMPLLRSIVRLHMNTSMLYKLGAADKELKPLI